MDNHKRIQNPVKHRRRSFLQKRSTIFNCYLFFAKYSILNVWLGSEYVSDNTKLGFAATPFISQKNQACYIFRFLPILI